MQQQGIDFDEVFSPVARIETIQLLITTIATNRWELHHLEVKTTFLHGELKETVYITKPVGYLNKRSEGKVYQISKALYGLRQSPRVWNMNLDTTLKQ